jgi:hypothetical protein
VTVVTVYLTILCDKDGLRLSFLPFWMGITSENSSSEYMQVKLDYGLPGSASSQGAPAKERILVVCSAAASEALLTAAGLSTMSAVTVVDPLARVAADSAPVFCIEVSGEACAVGTASCNSPLVSGAVSSSRNLQLLRAARKSGSLLKPLPSAVHRQLRHCQRRQPCDVEGPR